MPDGLGRDEWVCYGRHEVGFVRGFSSWRGPTAVIVTAALAGAAAPSSFAGTQESGGYNYVDKAGTGSDRLEGSAGCPDGTHLLSAGASTNGTFGTTAISSLFPADGDDSNDKPDDLATTRIDVLSVADKSIQVGAICAPGHYKYVSEDFKTKGHKGKTQSVDCPSGTKVTGGGLDARGGFVTQYMVASAPFDDADSNTVRNDGWETSVFNESDTQRKSTAWAICGEDDYTYVTPQILNGGAGASNTVQTDCPDGTFAVGGGVQGSADLGEQRITDTTSFNDVSGGGSVPDDGWLATMDNLSGATAAVSTDVICGPSLE